MLVHRTRLGFIFLMVLTMSMAKRISQRRHIRKVCKDAPNMREQLAEWLHESLEGGKFDDSPIEQWSSSDNEPEICAKPPNLVNSISIMERALCPWESRVNYEETREPKIIAESVCLCRKSRGSTGAFCMPIVRNVPVLRRVSCDVKTGYWNYAKSTESIIVGCHSVLPRTHRAIRLAEIGGDDSPV
ncbi:unnamed protein product [Caenorhabditis bovis]|uniref:Uncharacterized protein n=1 Tax=Caenorhabditis bovis TaxID=2654633 RepID=A0A8S1E526_9PELO|nr:unnamed protein product [Caenorhabditis bovis]